MIGRNTNTWIELHITDNVMKGRASSIRPRSCRGEVAAPCSVGVDVRIRSATSEGAELALHLGDVTTVPGTDPPLILWCACARSKNGCGELREALPLRIRA
jgi:hypothetical protein